jgi:hypothetical protein
MVVHAPASRYASVLPCVAAGNNVDVRAALHQQLVYLPSGISQAQHWAAARRHCTQLPLVVGVAGAVALRRLGRLCCAPAGRGHA